MSALVALLGRERLVAMLVALSTLMGVLALLRMPRQEDPSFVERFAAVIVPWPGADALRVERLVVEPVEDALAEVTELRRVEAVARGGVAVFTLELEDRIYETDAAWDEVRRALDDAARDLPAGAGPIALEDIDDPASVVLVLTGSDDRLALRDAMLRLEDHLLRVPGVARVERLADPGAQVSVRVDPALADRLALDAATVAGVLRARNAIAPGGAVLVDGRSAVLRPDTELADVEAVRATPIPMPDGSAIPLGELAEVVLEPVSPAEAHLFHDGAPAVGLSIVPELPQDLVAFGHRIRAAVDEARPALAPVVVGEFAFQPDHVRERLASLLGSLVAGVIVVGAVLLVGMGPRLGLVVSAVVPMVGLATIGIFAAGGGVLHQISIAALVLALGLLVDNAIVVAEGVQRHLDLGASGREAAMRAIRELAVPLGTATGTTVAAFVPMLLSSGGTADFTRSIPIVVSLALVLSYGFALGVTPALSARLLRPSPGGAEGRLERWAELAGRVSIGRPGATLLAVGALLLASAALLPAVRQQFFPLSDRPHVIATVTLPEGAHLDRTTAVVNRLERAALALPEVRDVTSFVGRGPPRFWYNLNDVPRSPHAATVVARAADPAAVPRVVEELRAIARALPEAEIVVKRLEQGPPVGAPVEIRLTGRSLADLHRAAEEVVRLLRAVPGTRDVRHDLGLGVPTLAWAIDDAAAGRHGLQRSDVARSLLASSRGLPAGELRSGEEPVEVVVVAGPGERVPVPALAAASVAAPGRPGVPVSAVADERIGWSPAAVRHRDRDRIVTVRAELAEGATFSEVLAEAGPRLAGLPLPDGVRLAIGGEAEGSSEANDALLRTLPVGIGLLLLFLLLEFDSWRRVGVVLVTVPLAAVGVIPGLALSGQPFGFMSLLGVIALVGIVVNNAIVLLDVIDQRLADGADLREAILAAQRQRIRPIVLTTATTLAGMLPLAVSDSPLWPPLAWAMLSGLAASTVLTLVAVPALVLLLDRGRRPSLPGASAAVAVGLLLLAPRADARPMTLAEVLDAGREAPSAEAAARAAEAAEADAATAWLAAIAPAIGAEATALRRDGAVAIDTPFGPLPQLPARSTTAGAEVVVPLARPGALVAAPAATRLARAADLDARRAADLAALAAGEAWLDVLAIDAQREANAAYLASLDHLASALREQVTADLAVPADLLRAEVALLDARQVEVALERQREVATRRLGALLGLGEPVEPAGEVTLPTAASAAERADLRALDERVAALRASRAAIRAEALPRVEAFGGVRWSDDALLADASWLEAGLRLGWTPVAGGTRLSRAAAAGQRLAAAEQQREQLALGIGVEVAAAEAALAVADAELAARAAGVAQAERARATVAERYAQGLATLTDLLAVEADLRAQRTRLRVAEVDRARAELRRRVAAGG